MKFRVRGRFPEEALSELRSEVEREGERAGEGNSLHNDSVSRECGIITYAMPLTTAPF
jgi:hypothetical protein